MNQPPSAQNVITLLREVQSRLSDKNLLAFICLPNIVLSLAGARGFGDGVFYSEDPEEREKWRTEITEVMTVLDHLFPIRYSVETDTNYSGETYVAFSFLNTNIAVRTLAGYSFFSEEDTQTVAQQFDQTRGFIRQLSPFLRQKELFQGWSDEAINAAAQGMLLGYPEKAILQTVPAITSDYETYTDLDLVEARISQATRYICPVPLYDYPRSLIDDPSILAHEALWSGILDGFYESKFFRTLDSPSFRSKLKEIGARN